MTTRDIVFAVIGVISAASAILAVTTRNLVHAALWLVVCLGTIAGCYVVLGAELVALVQVLIYVGAVVVLVLFALMLTRSPIGPNRELATPWWQRLLAALIGAFALAKIAGAGLVRTPRRRRSEPAPSAAAAAATTTATREDRSS